jgi:uncharacterized protein (TIGR02246 family)
MDATTVKAWLDKYQEAWRTDDRGLIKELFTEDAVYITGPFDDPWTGLDQIADGWIEIGDSDADWDFRYGIVAVTTEVAVVQGWTTYHGLDNEEDREYSNIWLIWFAPGGKVREFREWWVQKPLD